MFQHLQCKKVAEFKKNKLFSFQTFGGLKTVFKSAAIKLKLLFAENVFILSARGSLLMWRRKEAPVVWQTARTASRLSHGEEAAADVAERLTVSWYTMGWFYTIGDLWISVLCRLERGSALPPGEEQHEKSEILNRETRWTGIWSLCLSTWVFASLPLSITSSPSFIGGRDYRGVGFEFRSNATGSNEKVPGLLGCSASWLRSAAYWRICWPQGFFRTLGRSGPDTPFKRSNPADATVAYATDRGAVLSLK